MFGHAHVYQITGNGKGFARSQRYVDILLSNMLNARSTQAVTPELNVRRGAVTTFQFS